MTNDVREDDLYRVTPPTSRGREGAPPVLSIEADRPSTSESARSFRDIDTFSERDGIDGARPVEETEGREPRRGAIVEDESQDEADEVTRSVVDRLFTQLVEGHHGCSAEEHDERLARHLEQEGENHISLVDVSRDDTFPSVIELDDFITQERIATEVPATAGQWREMFEGVPATGEHATPKNVCLHAASTRPISAKMAYDIDSFLGFATSLGFAARGLEYQTIPLLKQNITADNHIRTNLYQHPNEEGRRGGTRLSMIRDIPHLHIGRLSGAPEVSVHVLFPYLATVGDKFVGMTQDQIRRWTDQVMQPALHRCLEAHRLQHMPSSYGHAYANSRAFQTENRSIKTASYQTQQALSYHIPVESTDEIWRDILETVSTSPGLADFRDPQLFFSAKGTKLQFKGTSAAPRLPDVLDAFETYLDAVIDLDLVDADSFWVDVGKEICPEVSVVPGGAVLPHEEAQVYTWKRCCLESYLKWRYDGRPADARTTWYGANLLHDACALTITPSRTSSERAAGLVYSQFYASVKEITDAAKCFPFANDSMEEMTLDPFIRKTSNSIAGGHRREMEVGEKAYLQSKKRTRGALGASRDKSFGLREEHRVLWTIGRALRARCRTSARPLPPTVGPCPPYAWAVTSHEYVDFLWRSADKFATGFEVVRARNRAGCIEWEDTKIMAMFLRCLRFVFGGHQLERESALWWSRRRAKEVGGRPPRWWIGLGFGHTLPKYGYGWIEPRVDWERLRFLRPLSKDVLFANEVLRGQWVKRRVRIDDFTDKSRTVDTVIGWMRERHCTARVIKRLVGYLAHLVLWQMRQDILKILEPDILLEGRPGVLRGTDGLSHDYVQRITGVAPRLSLKNRGAMRTPRDTYQMLFAFQDGKDRLNWENKPWRTLHQRTIQLLGCALPESADNPTLMALYSRLLEEAFVTWHWIVPQPSKNALFQLTKGDSLRLYFSLVKAVRPGSRYGWLEGEDGGPVPKGDPRARLPYMAAGGHDYVRGEPGPIPEWVLWGSDQWSRWLRRNAPLELDEAPATLGPGLSSPPSQGTSPPRPGRVLPTRARTIRQALDEVHAGNERDRRHEAREAARVEAQKSSDEFQAFWRRQHPLSNEHQAQAKALEKRIRARRATPTAGGPSLKEIRAEWGYIAEEGERLQGRQAKLWGSVENRIDRREEERRRDAERDEEAQDRRAQEAEDGVRAPIDSTDPDCRSPA